MEDRRVSPRVALAALLAALVVLTGSHLLAEKLKASSFYRQSHVIRLLLSQDSVGLAGMLEDGRNLDTLLKFTGALTSAYINFEMIPVGEVNTFVVVLESLRDGITIERFEYQRRDLTIYGDAADRGSYHAFLRALEKQGYFESVSEHSYLTTEDTVRFRIDCTAHAVNGYLDFM